MIIEQESLEFHTSGRGMVNITSPISDKVSRGNIQTGTCQVFLHHTSASIVICENADIDVQQDLEAFMARLVPDGDPLFKHVAEGDDDMPSHVKTILTQSCLSIPITDNRIALGTWQGIYLWEHRKAKHRRRITITMMGK